MHTKTFEPKLITAIKEGYSAKTFSHDLIAGIIVGIVALPLSIAFAIASGVKPEQGIYTAIVAGFLISAFSGSRVQIGGPTGAFIVIVYNIVQQYGYEGLATATFMAGIFLIILGAARMGDVIKFIPYPVTVGFTSGIALIIFTTQIRDFLGLTLTHTPEHFLAKWLAYLQNLPSINFDAFGLGILTVLIIMFWPRVTQKLPGTLIAIILTTGITQLLHLPIETIGSRFGQVPSTLPMPHLPFSFPLNIDLFSKLLSPALTIALLAGIESLLSAVVADGMTGRRHRSNMELIAQGIANIASPIFGGIPATGAIARTATNIKNGGRTPVAGIIHAITLLLIFLFFGKWAALIPMATLAGILITVAYNMSEWHTFIKLFRSTKSDIAVLLITFSLTVLVDLTVAIEVGVVLAAFLFMKRMVEVTEVNALTKSIGAEDDESDDPNAISKRNVPSGVEVYEIYGPFFFGAAEKFKDTLREFERPPQILILRMRYVPIIDATGLRVLEDLFHRLKKSKTTLILSGVNSNLLMTLKQSGIVERIGQENIVGHIDLALARAEDIFKIKNL